MTKQERIALRELLHQELDKCITAYFKRNPKKFEKMMVQFGEMKMKDLDNTLENTTHMFSSTLDPVMEDDNNRVFGIETVDELRKIFDIGSVTRMENKMVIQK
jgi:hypothetical protein